MRPSRGVGRAAAAHSPLGAMNRAGLAPLVGFGENPLNVGEFTSPELRPLSWGVSEGGS
jgi:hypothetical protein